MSATLQDFAQRLQSDISRRGLVPGAKYLTAQESALLLGTSVATANRVLRLLAEQEIVVRRRNSGTFVGPAANPAATGGIQTVAVLAPARIRNLEPIRFDLIMEGILAAQPDITDVHISWVPAQGSVEYVRGVLEPTINSGQLAGVVAVSCSRDVYRYLGENGYPMVVVGSLYPDQPYPFIDTDEHQAGRLMIEYLVARGHRRLVMFSDSEECPGDNYFHDGVSKALTAARLPHNALVLRTPGTDPAVLEVQMSELLDLPERPTGIIVKLPVWANVIAPIVARHGLRIPDDVEVIFKDSAVAERGSTSFPHAGPSTTAREFAMQIGQVLAQVRRGEEFENRAVLVPYEMFPATPGTGPRD